MKSIQKVTKVQLEINQNVEFLLLGLVSAEPDYKLSLAINKKFRIYLKNISPIKITDDSGHELLFSRFSNTGKTQDTVFYLVSNRSGNSFLLKKLKNIDYLFQVLNPENEKDIDQIISGLREIDSVNATFNIDIKTFKDKNIQYLTH